LSGTAWNDRISWIGGYYSLDESLDFRNVRWGMWEWATPGGKTIINGSSTQPDINVAAAEYVRQTALLLQLDGLIQPGSVPPTPSGGTMLTGAATVGGGAAAANRYPWLFTNISTDNLTNAWDEDEAYFGEATIGVTEKLDLTFGVRISDKTGGDITYQPTDAFRTIDPAVRPQGDPYAGSVIRELVDPETRISTRTSSRRPISSLPTRWCT
jgi:hypothetical protein